MGLGPAPAPAQVFHMDEKVICGKKHVKVQCILCKGWCWVQWPVQVTYRVVYKCHTCTEPKGLNVGKGVLPQDEMRFD